MFGIRGKRSNAIRFVLSTRTSRGAWQLFVANLKRHGIVRNRKVFLYDGMVIDGWQLYRGCLELYIKPKFEKLKLPAGMTIEEYVETFNDLRRHETQEQAIKRAEERRQRVVAARREGQSLRTIAAHEGISNKTVRDDLDKAREEGYTPELVTGLDGKTYRANGSAGGELEEPIPERLKQYFDSVPLFREVARLAVRLANRFEEIEKTPAYLRAVHGKKHKVHSSHIRAAGRAIEALMPKRPCPECGGEYEPSLENDPCKLCYDRGYQTAEEVVV